ncbi:microtubule integrity protein mal3 [Glugoides intestinalis]
MQMMSSRSSLIAWLNEHGISIEKIEEVGKGVALCELMKKIEKDFPPYKKEPRNENDYMYNLKLVRESIERRGFKMPFPIERLVKLKMQDNLEVLQNIYKNIAKKEAWLCDKADGKADDKADDKAEQASTIVEEELEGGRMTNERNSLEEAKEWIDILNRERDFYFKKLLEIERILKESIEETEKLKERIFKVLYKR